MNRKLALFLILCVLGLLLLNITLIGAYILLKDLGGVYLNPGEKYIVNIPFIGSSKAPMICGKAEQTDKTVLNNITIIVRYWGNESILGENTTGNDGKYCITLPEITSERRFNVSIKYDDTSINEEPLLLASNDYTLNFDSDKVYNKNEGYVFLTGNITNEDARIENGRIEIKIGYLDPLNNNKVDYKYGDYQRFYGINIEPNEKYEVTPVQNINWAIPSDAPAGKYKILFKTSFNAKEKTSQSVYFNITE